MAQEAKDAAVESPDAGAEAPGLWNYTRMPIETTEAEQVTERILAALGGETKRAVALYHDDWLLKAYRGLCREVIDPLRSVESGARESTALQNLLRKAASELEKDSEIWALMREAEEATNVLGAKTYNSNLSKADEMGWRYSHKAGGVNVWLRPSTHGINSVRMHAVYCTNILNVLPVINEVSLHHHLVPFLHAVDEAQISRSRKAAFGVIKVPMLSALIAPRYFSMYGYAVDAIDEDGAILIIVKDKSKAGEASKNMGFENACGNADEDSIFRGPKSPLGKFAASARETVMSVEHQVKHEETTAVQCEIHHASFIIRPGIYPDILEHDGAQHQRQEPCDSERKNYTTVEIESSFDPKIALAPSLINFVVKNFCHVAMMRMGKVSCTGTRDHSKAISNNQEFYDWVKCRVARG